MNLLTRPVCEVLGCSHPIVLAATGPMRRADRVAMVTEAGGFSFIDMAAASPDLIRDGIVRLSRLSNRSFGIALNPASVERALLGQQTRAAIALGVTVIGFFSDPGVALIRELASHGVVVARSATTVAEAVAAEQAGARLLISPLTAAGGGPLADIVEATKMPVLASGSIREGRDVALALALGADGAIIRTPELFLPLLTEAGRLLGPGIVGDAGESSGFASPVCYLGELDDAAAGFADRDALLHLFDGWLEAARAGARFAPGDAVEVLWCGVLEAAILALGGSPSRQTAPWFRAPDAAQEFAEMRERRATDIAALLPKIRSKAIVAALTAALAGPLA